MQASLLLNLFANTESSGPAIHIEPGELFRISEFIFTNSMVFGGLASIVIVIFLIKMSNKVTVKPKRGVIQLIEICTKFIMDTIQGAMGSRELAVKYAPLFASSFLFIMFSNWLGLLPGGGEAITWGETPIIRPLTADLNATLAGSAIMMVLVQYLAIKEIGLKHYMRHFFSGALWNPATYLLGVFEMFSEITKIFSLGLRLFLNVAIGEAIIVIFMYLGQFAAPLTALPIIMLEIFIGALQSYIFTMLVIMYLASVIAHHQKSRDLDRYDMAKAEVANA